MSRVISGVDWVGVCSERTLAERSACIQAFWWMWTVLGFLRRMLAWHFGFLVVGVGSGVRVRRYASLVKRIVRVDIRVDVWMEAVLEVVLAPVLVAWRNVGRETPIEAVPRVSFPFPEDVHSRAPSWGKTCSCWAT